MSSEKAVERQRHKPRPLPHGMPPRRLHPTPSLPGRVSKLTGSAPISSISSALKGRGVSNGGYFCLLFFWFYWFFSPPPRLPNLPNYQKPRHPSHPFLTPLRPH